MARINKSDIIQKAVNDLAISTSTDKIPTETLDKVQLTYDLNRKFSTFASFGSAVITGAMNIALPNVSVGSETYITGLTLGLVKDATCDVAIGSVGLSVTPYDSNIATSFLRIPILSLTAQSENVRIDFAYPFKVKSGSTITSTNSYTVGLMSRTCGITGFITSSN